MSEIEVQFTYERALWRRAMTAWWQSVVPPEPFVKRAIFWAVVWTAIGVIALVFVGTGQSPSLVVAGLFGAAVLIAVFAYLQRTRMGRFWDVVGSHWDKAGETIVRFGPDGVKVTDQVSRRAFDWGAIDAIKGVRGGTVLRSGIAMVVIPDNALPEGLDAQAFRVRLNDWRKP
ncbi:MAG: hypothetical protein HKN27_00060 [Silicimonas sp.]|nr:hypothetical protein [Silicimonas sp.]